MGRARPWLLVGSVAMVGFLVALAWGSAPPQEERPEWQRQGIMFTTERMEVDFRFGSDDLQVTVPFLNELPNVTAVSVYAHLVIYDVQGDGAIKARLVVEAANGTRAETVRQDVYTCAEPFPSPITFQCDEPIIVVEFDIDGWDLSAAPDAANDSSLSPPPPDRSQIGQWNTTVSLDLVEEARYARAEGTVFITYYVYSLRPTT